MKKYGIFTLVLLCLVMASCSKQEELELSEIDEISASGDLELLKKTVTRPWDGSDFKPGKVGGIWNDTIINDPKTFNQLINQLFKTLFF